jgi:hypothetical protein
VLHGNPWRNSPVLVTFEGKEHHIGIASSIETPARAPELMLFCDKVGEQLDPMCTQIIEQYLDR